MLDRGARWIDVNAVVREMLVLAAKPGERNTRCRLRTDLAADPITKSQPTACSCSRCLMNLMLNGIEAMSGSGGELTITSRVAQDGQLTISVSDTGVGLPTGQSDQIFAPFFSTKPQGTGMGLSISRSIVESHGGRLWATANAGRGATFHFTLPAEVMNQSVAESGV